MQDVGIVLEGEASSLWGPLHGDVCKGVFVRAYLMHDAYACGGERGSWCLKKTHQDQHQRIELVRFSLTLFSALKLPSSSLWASLCRKFENRYDIFLCYDRVELCITTFGAKCERRDSAGDAQQVPPHPYIYCCFLLSNGLSHPVTPPLHTPHPMCHCNCMYKLAFFHSLPLLLIYRY